MCLSNAGDGYPKNILDMISSFWQSIFYHDNQWLGSYSLKYSSLRSYLVWSEKTKEDPTFITDINWPVQVMITDFGKLDYQDYCCYGFRKGRFK